MRLGLRVGLNAFINNNNAHLYAPYPAPSGFKWDFVTWQGMRVTWQGVPVVALVVVHNQDEDPLNPTIIRTYTIMREVIVLRDTIRMTDNG